MAVGEVPRRRRRLPGHAQAGGRPPGAGRALGGDDPGHRPRPRPGGGGGETGPGGGGEVRRRPRGAPPGYREELRRRRAVRPSYAVRSPTDPRSRLLGFGLPEEIAELAGDEDAAKISAEEFELLARDLLLWNAGFSPGLRAEPEGDPVYQSLAVAEEGRAPTLDDEPLSGALTWSTVLSPPYAIEELTPASPPP
ncbi:hypothetical protein [Nocardiopsis composta]|uniref:Uncharacterized protein n=1 Tax=Nocardiopsis composta TaxID=157465 RepID=A0A7W8QQN9_9ACTN|nr:hypothetical protein [Nocardiopsis composta]MBB5434148.1 hypothetical protein [Nocardiopsis composta]